MKKQQLDDLKVAVGLAILRLSAAQREANKRRAGPAEHRAVEAAQAHCDKLSAELRGRAVFIPASATMKLNIVGETGDGAESATEAKARTDWQARATRFGLELAWLGETICSGSGNYTILGLLPNRHKYPVMARRESDGRDTLLTVASVQQGMAMKAVQLKAFLAAAKKRRA